MPTQEEELLAAIEADGVNNADDFRLAETISTLLDRHYENLSIAAGQAGRSGVVVEAAQDARSDKSGRFSVVHMTYNKKHFLIEVTELD